MPDLPEPVTKGGIPDWFDSQDIRKHDLLKASDGSSSVSELRVHLVWCTKRRGKVLTAPMVEQLKVLTAEAVEAKGLGRLLAVNAEEDHVHVALHLPANLSGSEAVGPIKAYTARMLRREFPALKDHHDESLWQRGFYAGAIGNGGDLSSVLAYIANQDAPQDDQEDAPDSGRGNETGAT
ncbi:Transposase IS200 like protein [compost metagenome]